MTIDTAIALRHLRRVEPRFAPLIEEHGPPRFSRTRNSFRSLVHAIIYQQISGSAAAAIYRRFCDLFDCRGFPTPAAVVELEVDELREAGLSRQKAIYISEVALTFVDGSIAPRRFNSMTNDEISEVLTAVKGIGQWSADMFLMFALNRPDILPVGDLGIRKGMKKFFRLRSLPEPPRMIERAEPWQPWRSVASWYMWRVLESE